MLAAVRSLSTVRWLRRAVRVLAAASLLLVGGCDAGLPEGPEGPGTGGFEDVITRLVNDHRQRLGCPRLRWSWDLAGVAQSHSADMVSRAYFGHEDPEGRGLAQRLRAARIPFSRAAENIAMGFQVEDAARAVFDAWMKSGGHREVIESCAFTFHGLGVVDYRWTHVFTR